ncbi:MAG: pyridoxal 5'-phosphate synthase glutaminase subunit PdxT [Egibacteraceae bacterium]
MRVAVGVLGLQGDVAEHVRMLEGCGVRAPVVRRVEELEGLDGLVLPGGESTTIGRLLDRYGLLEPLRERLREGLPAFGTCAGAILMGRAALTADGQPSDQPLLGVMDLVTRRNAFGRQVDSFEDDLDVAGLEGPPLHAVFIRAPWVEEVGPGVEVLATVNPRDREGELVGDKVVLARQGHHLVSAFHPELTGDSRLHRLFVEVVKRARRQ